MSDWRLVYDGLDPEEEGLREALCTLANGYFATRGAAPESSADDVHYPGTYAAGVFNRLATDVDGREVFNESIVNLPNWLPLAVRGPDGWFDDRHARVVSPPRRARPAPGAADAPHDVRGPGGPPPHPRPTPVRQHARPPSGRPRDDDRGRELGRTGRRSGARSTARVRNAGWRATPVSTTATCGSCEARQVSDEVIELVAETTQSHIRVAMADPHPCEPCRRPPGDRADGGGRRRRRGPGVPRRRVARGEPVTVEKVVALVPLRRRGHQRAGASRPGSGRRRSPGTSRSCYARHQVTWHQIWGTSDIRLGIDHEISRKVHLHLFHLLQTVSGNTVGLDVGVPARGLHGEAYRGHIFWDELFVFPFLSTRFPQVTRSLLLYRYRRLDAARRAAADAGFAGAMFPWQSGSSGREETQTAAPQPRLGAMAARRLAPAAPRRTPRSR